MYNSREEATRHVLDMSKFNDPFKVKAADDVDETLDDCMDRRAPQSQSNAESDEDLVADERQTST